MLLFIHGVLFTMGENLLRGLERSDPFGCQFSIVPTSVRGTE